MHNCKEVAFDGGVIEFVTKAKYLGVMLKVGKNFAVCRCAVYEVKFLLQF